MLCRGHIGGQKGEVGGRGPRARMRGVAKEGRKIARRQEEGPPTGRATGGGHKGGNGPAGRRVGAGLEPGTSRAGARRNRRRDCPSRGVGGAHARREGKPEGPRRRRPSRKRRAQGRIQPDAPPRGPRGPKGQDGTRPEGHRGEWGKGRGPEQARAPAEGQGEASQRGTGAQRARAEDAEPEGPRVEPEGAHATEQLSQHKSDTDTTWQARTQRAPRPTSRRTKAKWRGESGHGGVRRSAGPPGRSRAG